MQISNVINNPFIYLNKPQGIQPKQPAIIFRSKPNCDTVSFCSRDLLSCSEDEIIKKVKTSVTDKGNYLGAGADAQVYKIPDTNYCIRILYKDEEYKSGIPDLLKRKKLGLNYNISEKDKINHVVAKFPRGTIMKFIEGVPVMTPFMSEKEIKENSKNIQEVPVSSFRKLLHQICHAYENNMMFDCNYANLIVNPKNKTITAIDFYDMTEGATIEEASNPFTHIYSGVTHKYTTVEQKKEIANKLLQVGLEELKTGYKPCCDIRNLDFYKFIYRLYDERIIESYKFTKLLVKLFSEMEELKLQELHGEDVKNLLNGKMKVAKCLIKQLL